MEGQQPPVAQKAVVLRDYGSPANVLTVQQNVALRPLRENDVLVEVHASSVNPIDWKICVGYARSFLSLELPTILGYDFSGVVLDLGAKAKSEGRLSIGQEVWGMSKTRGAYATHLVVDASVVGPKPASLSHLETASIPLAGLTAYQGLVNVGGLTRGQRVLILGASGGVGSAAVYLAKALGLFVASTCSERNVDFVTQLGSDRVIDYTKADWSKVLKADSEHQKYDVIYDTVGDRDAWARAPKVLKRGGIFVAIAGQKGEGSVEDQDQIYQYKFFITDSNKDDLEKIKEIVDGGAFHAHLDSVYPLEQLAEAFEKSKAGKVVGKIGIKVKGE